LAACNQTASSSTPNQGHVVRGQTAPFFQPKATGISFQYPQQHRLCNSRPVSLNMKKAKKDNRAYSKDEMWIAQSHSLKWPAPKLDWELRLWV
jgi:hypothetical protein